jgi:hypothetical protein
LENKSVNTSSALDNLGDLRKDLDLEMLITRPHCGVFLAPSLVVPLLKLVPPVCGDIRKVRAAGIFLTLMSSAGGLTAHPASPLE